MTTSGLPYKILAPRVAHNRPALLGGVSFMVLGLGLVMPAQPVMAAVTSAGGANTSAVGSSTYNGTLTNSGSIVGGAATGLTITGSANVLTNSGLISSTALAGVSIVSSAGVASLSNTGTIMGMTGISNAGTIATLTNNGAIIGSLYGVNNSVSIGSFTNSGSIIANGNITGTSPSFTTLAGTALTNSGTIDSLVNSSLISGTLAAGGIGISNTSSGLISSLSNAALGSIYGGATALSNSGSIGVLSNLGTITGGTIGLSNAGSAVISSLSNKAGGTISGGVTALSNSGTIGTLTNAGSISGSLYGIKNASSTASITTLSNSGLINATAAAGVALSNAGSIGAVSNSGTINASGSTGIAVSNTSTGTIASLNNSGRVAGGTVSGGAGVSNAGQVTTLTNAASNTITGYVGVKNTGNITTLSNASAARIYGQTGVYNGSLGTIGSLSNSGTISGVGNAIYNSANATIGTLTNAGLILSTGYAINSAGVLGTVTNTGTISGNISVSGGDLSIVGGTSSTYGTLTGGTISVPGHNLYFVSGNQLLGDNINVNSGSGTVTNSGNLLLVAAKTITGNYSQGSTGTLSISGSSATTGGQLIISGAASMANAKLAFTTLSGYSPAAGSTYTLVSGNSSSNYAGDSISLAISGFTGSLSSIISGALDYLILTFASSGPTYSYGTLTANSAGVLSNTGSLTGSIAGYYTTGSVGSVSNSGYIHGGVDGVLVSGGSIGTFSNAGSVSGGTAGVALSSNATISAISNSGLISGGKYGVYNDPSVINTLTNAAGSTISATNTTGVAIYSNGVIGALTNAGLIIGNAYAIYSDGSSNGSLGTVTNTGTISGNIYVSGQNLAIAGASGSNFGTLTGGSITVPNGNLTFVSGNQVLADNISVKGGSGTVTNAGNLALSTAQTITGNYAQGSAGTLTVAATSASTGGKLQVSGAASMANTNIVFQALSGYAPATGSTYTLVAAGGSSSTYAGDKLTLNMANYITNLVTSTSTSGSSLVLDIQKVPTIYADTSMVQRDSFLMTSGAVDQELQSLRGAPAPAAGKTSIAQGAYNTWMSATGQFVSSSAAGGAPGYSAQNGGVVLGVDHGIAGTLRAGLAIAALQQNIGGGSGTSYSGQAEQLQLYLTGQHQMYFVDAQGGVLLNQGTAKRSMATTNNAQGNVNGTGFGGSVRAGVRINTAAWQVEPGVTFGGMSLSQDAVNETGAGNFNLAINKGSLKSFYAMPGVEADRTFKVASGYNLTTAVRVGWRHEMMNTSSSLTASVGGSSATFGSAPIARDAAEMGLNMELQTPTRVRLFTRYQADVNSRSNSQQADGGVKMSW